MKAVTPSIVLVLLGAPLVMAASPPNAGGASQWQTWLATGHTLLDTPEKAVDFAEAVVRAAYGPEQTMQERPFVADDLGDAWRVHGEGQGSHALPFFAVSSTVTLSKRTGAILDYTLSRPPSPDVAKELGR